MGFRKGSRIPPSSGKAGLWRAGKCQVSSLKPAFTLVEIFMGIALIGIIALLVAVVFFAHFKVFTSQTTAIDVASQGQIALGEITNQIRESQGVALSCCAGESSGPNVLVLQLWSLDASGQPVSTPLDYIYYEVGPNNTLIKNVVPTSPSTRPAKTDDIIASNISSLTFAYAPNTPTNAAATKVTVTIETRGMADRKEVVQTQSSEVVLRNKP